MADVLAVRDEYRAQTWSMLIQECNNSGLTKREFCQQRGISEKSFYYWLRKLPVLNWCSWIRKWFQTICCRSSTGAQN